MLVLPAPLLTVPVEKAISKFISNRLRTDEHIQEDVDNGNKAGIREEWQ
jgi:hypothetical protein